MKALFLAVFVAVGLSAVAVGLGAGASQTAEILAYHTPAHNYYQNNWMSG
jgi:hypothetical protein